MPLSRARLRFNNLLLQAGRAGLHSLFPNDFEYYAIAFELVNSQESTEQMLIFPVLPDEIREEKTTLNNIKKSGAGVVSLFNPSFNPFSIRLTGTFGRKFQILLNDETAIVSAISGQLKQGSGLFDEPPQFNLGIKTGYGVTKLLEKIYEKHKLLDEYGKPYRLYFYNLALNSNHLVTLDNLELSQNVKDSNMVWTYSMRMTAIAPASATKKFLKSSLITVLLFDNLQREATTSFNAFRSTFFTRAERYLKSL